MNGSAISQNMEGTRGLSHGNYKTIWFFFAVLVIAGFMNLDNIKNFFAYLVICAAVMWPAWLWMRMGKPGIPILPAVALLHLQYYALPILIGNYKHYHSPTEILTAGLSVALYLIVVTAVWMLIVLQRSAKKPAIVPQGSREMIKIEMAGLWFGVLFYIGLFYGLYSWMGSAFGVIRAIALILISISCFLVGVTWGLGKLSSRQKRNAVLLISFLLVLDWTSLFLVTGVMWIAVALLGYFASSRRVPVTALLIAIPMIYILHAGKAEMRDRYWGESEHLSTVTQIPSFYMGWTSSGISAITEGKEEQNVFERASLLEMLLRAQDETPSRFAFLYGETYEALPALLVPRFLWPDKPVSQEAMNMLNLRYGLVHPSRSGEIKTAIGWGIISEAYVNFGMFGIVGIGIVMGILIGVVSEWSKGKPAVSLPTLVAVATMIACMDLEMDFTYLCTVFFQSFIAVFIFYGTFRFLTRQSGAA